MPNESDRQEQWLRAIASTLAHFALQQPEVKGKKLLEKAAFLSRLGFPEKIAADILGTTTASLSELRRQAKNRKRGGKARATKTKREG